MPKFSVVIVCANAESTLEAACRSVQSLADDLVIVDSGSNDRTAEIAKQFATKYVLEPWRGFVDQRKFAAEFARNDWVFFLDSDEECTPQLRDELNAVTQEELDKLDLLLVPRENYVMGHIARAWWPDHQTRVFHRHRIIWGDHALHDKREASDPSRVRTLQGRIIHKRVSGGGFNDYFGGARMDARLLPVAQQMYDKGKRCHWWDLVFRPQVAFWKFYLLKRGFLDGTFGLLIAQKAAVSTQLKYAALWAVQNDSATVNAKPQPEASSSGASSNTSA